MLLLYLFQIRCIPLLDSVNRLAFIVLPLVFLSNFLPEDSYFSFQLADFRISNLHTLQFGLIYACICFIQDVFVALAAF